MNSFAKFIASTSALIASLSLAWIALTITGVNPNHAARVTLYYKGDVGVELGGDVELTNGSRGFDIRHDGSVEITR